MLAYNFRGSNTSKGWQNLTGLEQREQSSKCRVASEMAFVVGCGLARFSIVGDLILSHIRFLQRKCTTSSVGLPSEPSVLKSLKTFQTVSQFDRAQTFGHNITLNTQQISLFSEEQRCSCVMFCKSKLSL